MISEFLWLTLLTVNDDEREILREKVNQWVKLFLSKLCRETTRTAKCRLIASVERHEFEDEENAVDWRFCKFDENKGFLFDQDKVLLEEFPSTFFQKKLLPGLENIFIGRSEIREENGQWKLEDELKGKLINSGGEAVVFSEEFGETEMAVRVQIFDPFFLTKKFGDLKWKTHLISGEFIFSCFMYTPLRF